MGHFTTILAQKAISDLDLYPSYLLEVKALNYECKYPDAWKFCLQVLDGMGERLPSEHEDEAISKEIKENIFQSAHALSNIMKKLNIVEDRTIIAKCQFLSVLSLTAHYHCPKLFPVIGGRILKLTFDHGLSKYSATGLAIAGKMFCFKDDFENGYLFGQEALAVVDKFKAKDLFSSLVAYLHTSIFYYKMPLHQMMKLPKKAIETSLQIGDNESATHNLGQYYCYSFFSGKRLQDLIDEYDSKFSKIPRKGNLTLSIYQSVLNLAVYDEGRQKHGLLIGKYFDYRHDIDLNKPMLTLNWLVYLIPSAYILNEYNVAKEWLEVCKPMKNFWLIRSKK